LVTVRVVYTAEDISDYLVYATDLRGILRAELPTSPGAGALHITATDHRTDPDGACGLLWSNAQMVFTRPARPSVDEFYDNGHADTATSDADST
jgi:hypothetical protein